MLRFHFVIRPCGIASETRSWPGSSTLEASRLQRAFSSCPPFGQRRPWVFTVSFRWHRQPCDLLSWQGFHSFGDLEEGSSTRANTASTAKAHASAMIASCWWCALWTTCSCLCISSRPPRRTSRLRLHGSQDNASALVRGMILPGGRLASLSFKRCFRVHRFTVSGVCLCIRVAKTSCKIRCTAACRRQARSAERQRASPSVWFPASLPKTSGTVADLRPVTQVCAGG